jgi:hypothetical protein
VGTLKAPVNGYAYAVTLKAIVNVPTLLVNRKDVCSNEPEANVCMQPSREPHAANRRPERYLPIVSVRQELTDKRNSRLSTDTATNFTQSCKKSGGRGIQHVSRVYLKRWNHELVWYEASLQ